MGTHINLTSFQVDLSAHIFCQLRLPQPPSRSSRDVCAEKQTAFHNRLQITGQVIADNLGQAAPFSLYEI